MRYSHEHIEFSTAPSWIALLISVITSGAVLIGVTLLSACGPNNQHDRNYESAESLSVSLHELANKAPGMVGIALVSDSDTITVNNGVRYPMMSVFKLHQALATADRLASSGQTFDTTLSIRVPELNRNTWSPMLKKYGNEDFKISVGELARYAVTSSDNNASNLLFNHIVSPEETDRFIRTIAPDTTFQIHYSESAMKERHDLSYANYTSPLAAALLIRKVFTDSVVSPTMQDSIKTWLSTVTTGTDRLGAPVMDNPEVFFAHKTGSGYRNPQGELIAHNDVGFFRLPDGRTYSLAVLIRDFNGSEDEASSIIAEISRLVYNSLSTPR